jgi:hypothetical protein
VTGDPTPAQRASLDALRSARGRCPDAAALVEYEALGGAARPAHPAHAHIVSCSRCQLALLHMAEPAAAIAGGGRWRWALPLAAAAMLAVALTLVDRGERPSPAPGAATESGGGMVRGTELQITSPAGATDQLREFAWQSPITADRYRVIVRRGTTVVWQVETASTRIAPPPPGTIERDVQYEWQVEALDREGHVRMASPSQSFVVY